MNAYRLLSFLLVATTARAGILVSHAGQGFQFAEAAALTFNGKDKALSIGGKPSVAGGKFPSIKITGLVLKDGDSGALGLYDQGSLGFLIPEGLKNPSGDAGAIWRAAKIAYKKTEKDKAPTEIPAGDFVAFLPGGPEDLARIATEANALQILGGKGKALPFQLELLAASARYPGIGAAGNTLEKYVETAMRQPYEQFENGMAGVEALDQGLKYAALSADVYAKNPEQEKLRGQLKRQRDWIDRKRAVLRAFAAAKEWDAYLLGDREFEKYQHAFPDMQALHGQALKQSLQVHSEAGKERMKENEFGAAFRELRLASMRKPSDGMLQSSVSQAWEGYSKRLASDTLSARKRPTPEERVVIDRALTKATRYKEDKRLDEALKAVGEAEAISADDLPVLLKKAEVLGAMGDISKAMAVLDRYDLRAVDEQRQAANKLRNDLSYAAESSLSTYKKAMKAAWAESSFYKVRQLTMDGLRAKDDDPDLLYYAGLASLATRNPTDSRTYFSRYLEVSNTLDADGEQRAAVRRVLPSIGTAPAAAPSAGSPNWLSGNRLPENIYYDPVSGAFQPKIDRVEASNKLKVTFEWEGDKLRSITPVFEKNERVTEEKRVSFAYDEKPPRVVSVALDADARPLGTNDPDEALKRSAVVLLNNPYADPVAVQRLTNRNITAGIAGNRYFLPFLWDRVHYFKLTYDSSGRISTAREIADARGAPADNLVEFHWEGMQLKSITAYQISGETRGGKTYERTMEYQGGQLVGESIQGAGKTMRIKYVYAGGRLASAECEKDLTLDQRSRKVFFK